MLIDIPFFSYGFKSKGDPALAFWSGTVLTQLCHNGKSEPGNNQLTLALYTTPVTCSYILASTRIYENMNRSCISLQKQQAPLDTCQGPSTPGLPWNHCIMWLSLWAALLYFPIMLLISACVGHWSIVQNFKCWLVATHYTVHPGVLGGGLRTVCQVYPQTWGQPIEEFQLSG